MISIGGWVSFLLVGLNHAKDLSAYFDNVTLREIQVDDFELFKEVWKETSERAPLVLLCYSTDSKISQFASMEIFEICPWCWKLFGKEMIVFGVYASHNVVYRMQCEYSSTDSSVNMPLFIPNSSIHTIVGGMDHSLRPNYFVFDEVVFVNKDYVISLPCHRGHSSKGCNPTKWSDIIAPEDLSEEQKEFIDRNCFEEPNRHCVQERDNSNEPTGQIVMLPEPVIAHSFGMSVYVKQVDSMWTVRIFDHETGDHYVIFPYLSTAPSALRAFEFVEGDFHYFSNDYYHALFKFPLIQRSDKFFSRKFQAGYQQPTAWRKDESTTENATTEVTTSAPRSDVCILRSQVEEKTCRPVPRVFQKKATKSLTEDDRFVGAVVGSIILAGIIVGVIAILWVWRKCPMKPKRLPDIPITYRSDNEDV
ncbi:hypothetical protein M3Y96_00158800 [Aphelenchoides besseyi]|nr:hypothetical protein M3Y96_00158800 [Aphelenchoides besseyi]